MKSFHFPDINVWVVLTSLVIAGCSEQTREAGRTASGSAPTRSESPDCSGVEQWATSMALVQLKNASFTDNDRLDFSKTVTKRLASEEVAGGLFRQVHHVVFTEKNGHRIEAITVNDASHEECSMSGVDVYVIDKHLGPE